jgi:hypothetical protein
MRPSVILQAPAVSAVWDRVTALASGLGNGALELGIAVLVCLVGWLLARLLSRLTLLGLRALRFNEGIRRLGNSPGGPERFEPAAIASWAVYWIVLLLAALTAGDVLGFDLTASVGDRLREVLPRVAAATIVLVVGIVVAMGLGAVTERVFETAGMRGSRLRGQVVAVVLGAFAVLIALEQLGLAAQFIMALGITAVATVGLAAALAFGLGCRELARDFIVEYLRTAGDESPQRPS